LLSARFDGELDAASNAAADRHLAACAAWREAAAALAAATARFARLRAARAPLALRERVLEAARRERPRVPPRVATRAAAALLGALLSLAAAGLARRGAPAPQPALEVAAPTATPEQARRIARHLADAAHLLAGGWAPGDAATLDDPPEARLLQRLRAAEENR
jgi:anti-sigma factor RsiW